MARLLERSFDRNEQVELTDKVKTALTAAGFEALITAGSRHITYLTPGIVFPYLDQRLVDPVVYYWNFVTNRRLLVCTYDLSDIPQQLGWDGDVLVYSLTEATPELSLAAALAPCLDPQEIAGRSVGYDLAQMSGALFAALQAALPEHDGNSCEPQLTELKMRKTPAEVRLLEIAGRMGDRGFISALNHAEGAALDTLSYPIWEYGERFRVHVGEFGGSGVGNLSVLRGDRTGELYGRTGTREIFSPGEFVRMEYSLHSYGYWSTGARTVYVGRPDLAARQAYADNLRLKNAAVAALRPGQTSAAVYRAVLAASAATGIDFWATTDIGHGLGTAEREAPFLAPYDATILEPGMVLVVSVYTYGPHLELIVNKDVYHITAEGPELLTWYKNWNSLYALHGTSARHG